MRALVATVLAVLATMLAAGCGSSGVLAAAPATTSASPSASASVGGAEADACKVLAAMTWDASTTDAVAKTQDQMNAALNLLPQHDALGADLLVAEQDLVTVDTDVAGAQMGGSTDTTQLHSDLDALQGALGTMASDCSSQGVPFSVNLQAPSS